MPGAQLKPQVLCPEGHKEPGEKLRTVGKKGALVWGRETALLVRRRTWEETKPFITQQYLRTPVPEA